MDKPQTLEPTRHLRQITSCMSNPAHTRAQTSYSDCNNLQQVQIEAGERWDIPADSMDEGDASVATFTRMFLHALLGRMWARQGCGLLKLVFSGFPPTKRSRLLSCLESLCFHVHPDRASLNQSDCRPESESKPAERQHVLIDRRTQLLLGARQWLRVSERCSENVAICPKTPLAELSHGLLSKILRQCGIMRKF